MSLSYKAIPHFPDCLSHKLTFQARQAEPGGGLRSLISMLTLFLLFSTFSHSLQSIQPSSLNMGDTSQSHVGTPSDLLSPANPTVQKFFSDREALIAQEKSKRSGTQPLSPFSRYSHLFHADHAFRLALSPIAAKACEIVSKIRSDEHKSVWSSVASEEPEQELFPGMIFNAAKATMQSTQLFRIVSKMPKGALLHCHLGAMVDLKWVFSTAIETKGMCFSSDRPLVAEEAREKARVKIEYCKLGTSGSVWDESYVAGTQIHVKEAADSFPDSGRQGFISWLKERCSITQSDSIRHHLGINDIWKKLVWGFTMITPIVFYEPITRKFLREFFRTAQKDGIKWIEMRGMTRSFRLEGEDYLVKDRTELVRVVHEEVESFKASEEGKGFWGVRMIWDCLRSFDDDAIIDGISIYPLTTSQPSRQINFFRHAAMPPCQKSLPQTPLRLRPRWARRPWPHSAFAHTSPAMVPRTMLPPKPHHSFFLPCRRDTRVRLPYGP